MRSLTVSETARRLSRETGQTVSPQDISNLFYKRHLDDERCPVVGRFRLIPEEYLPTIERVLREHGLLSACADSPDGHDRTFPAADAPNDRRWADMNRKGARRE